MAKRQLAITVRGKQHSWSFHFEGDPKYLAEWRDDGLEIDEVHYSIPESIVDLRITARRISFQKSVPTALNVRNAKVRCDRARS